MKKINLLLLLTFAITTTFAQIPAGYYDSAEGLTGETLREELRSIITSGHSSNQYDDLFDYYESTDNYGNNKVWDMYSIHADGTANYWFTHISDKCSSGYSGEGDCYNREHSVPHSWMGTGESYAEDDLFIVVPTDGYVNNRRNNYPYGETDNPSWTSTNGSKLGPCSYLGYSGTIFEPIDKFKGDFARAYFYTVTRYNVSDWGGASFSEDGFSSWTLNMLLEWHHNDPVSQKEIDRNNAVYNIQHNRNPYIDHPEWVECVWNNNCTGSVEDPANLSAVGVTTSEIDLTWNLNTNSDDVLLAYNTTNTFGTPSGTYNTGDPVSGGGTVLIAGNTTSFNHTGLNPQTYYYKIWSFDGTDYSSGITSSATPLIGEPTNHVTNFTVINADASTIDLSWTDATGSVTPSGYLIKANYSGSAITPPSDGQPEADGTFTKNIASGIQIVTFNSLNSNTAYDFEIFPYTNGGINIDYKTDGTIPSATGTTTDVPTNCGNETFDGMTTGSSSYTTVNWTGQDGSQWTATNSRTDQDLGNGPAICIKGSSSGEMQSGTIENGISDITISTLRAFSGNTGTVEIFVNDNSIGTVPYSDVLQTTTISDINISGPVVLKFAPSDDRVIIDDIIWTCNGSSPSNTLPEFTSTPITTATAGQTYTYNITANDADAGDVLTITSPTIPAWLTLTDNGNGTATLSGTPQNSDAGDNLVSINVSDGTGSVNQNFTIDVTAVNTAPEFTSTPITSATAGQNYTYNITTFDADGDNLTITAPAKPTWLTLSDNGNGTATLSGTPQNSDAGNNTVSLNVYDGIDNVNQDFTIDVTESSSVNSQNLYRINIYPNPAKNKVMISSNRNINSVKLINILGKIIYEKREIKSHSFSINLKTLPTGIYFIKIKNLENKTLLKKLIIE